MVCSVCCMWSGSSIAISFLTTQKLYLAFRDLKESVLVFVSYYLGKKNKWYNLWETQVYKCIKRIHHRANFCFITPIILVLQVKIAILLHATKPLMRHCFLFIIRSITLSLSRKKLIWFEFSPYIIALVSRYLDCKYGIESWWDRKWFLSSYTFFCKNWRKSFFSNN